MSGAQRTIIFLGLLAIIALSLYPPFQMEHAMYLINYETGVPHRAGVSLENIGHHWIWSPPQREQEETRREIRSHIASVDWPRLGVYVGLIIAVTLFLAFVLFNRKPDVFPKTWKG